MKSHIPTLKRVLTISSSKLKFPSTRRRYSQSSSCLLQQLDSHLHDLNKSVSPAVLTLDTFFSAPNYPQIHRSFRRGAGVFVDPTLILTSAHIVGRIATYYESKPVEKSDRFDQGYVLHKSYIGNTVARTSESELVKTTPLAVNFAYDVAVLKVVKDEETRFPHCAVANLNSSTKPAKEDILMAIAHRENVGFVSVLGNIRSIGERTVRAKAPWPLDDGLRWMEHDWFMFGGDSQKKTALFNRGEKVGGVVGRISGSPWFNLDGEVVGIASWEARDEPARLSVGFAVPPVCIRAMLDYAKTKGPDDPIVMDRWIDSHVILGVDDCDVNEDQLT